uniref:Beta-lactamase-related domain-containing protein n=1 Tax=Araucaria cunninghamii TaxID=56994 RepID=A0A0D6QWG5_ARACU
MAIRTSHLATLLLVTFLSNAIHGLSKEFPEMAKFDQVMKMLMAYSNVPGAQLAVAKGGELKYFKAFGIANRDTGAPVVTDSVMRYNSISKVITGTAILKLVQEGKLSLDYKPFRDLEYLEPPKGTTVDSRLQDITVQNLLQHTAGWDRTAADIDILSQPATLYAAQALSRPPPPTPQEAIRFMKGLPLDFPPGSEMQYSNFGYIVLGRVVEKAAGVPYGRYVHENLLHPLGLTGILLGHTQLDLRAPDEVLYYGINGEDSPWVSIFPGQGFVNRSYASLDYSNLDSAAGWIGSAGDIVRFVDHIDGLRPPAILRVDMVYAMLNAPMPSKRYLKGDRLFDHSRGLNVFVSVDGNGKITSFQHRGAATGAHSFVMRLTEENITFAYVVNTWPVGNKFVYIAAGNLSEVAKSIKNWPDHDLRA